MLQDLLAADQKRNHDRQGLPILDQEWVNLVYRGFFFDPQREDLEAYLNSSQIKVTGDVTIQLEPGKAEAIAVDSKNVLISAEGSYAQSAKWPFS